MKGKPLLLRRFVRGVGLIYLSAAGEENENYGRKAQARGRFEGIKQPQSLKFCDRDIFLIVQRNALDGFPRMAYGTI